MQYIKYCKCRTVEKRISYKNKEDDYHLAYDWLANHYSLDVCVKSLGNEVMHFV